jgi:cytidylate kinase
MAILSISREFMGGGEEIGRAVAEKMNYDYVDRDRILKDMTRNGERWRRLGEDLDEARPTLWERYDWEYRGFVSLMESYLYQYALQDNVVIMGRGSNILLQGIPFALSVRLTAPLDKRIERAVSKYNIDEETAKALIAKTDDSRSAYIQVNYGKNWEDHKYYDMVLNTSTQTYEQITNILMAALKEKDRQAVPEAKKELRERCLAAKVKAKICTDSRFFIPTLEVSSQEGVIVLRGVVHNQKEYQLIEEIARTVTEGQKTIKNQLHYRV